MQLQASHASRPADNAGLHTTLFGWVEHTPYWDDSCLARRVFVFFCVFRKFFSVPRCATVSPVTVRSHINAVLAGPSYCFGVTFPNKIRSPKWLFSVRFLHRNSTYSSLSPHSSHIPLPSPPSNWLPYNNNNNNNNNVKVKQSRYRPGVAQRVPGS